MAVQWLGLCAVTAEGKGSVPGRGTKIPQATWRGQKKKRDTDWKGRMTTLFRDSTTAFTETPFKTLPKKKAPWGGRVEEKLGDWG